MKSLGGLCILLIFLTSCQDKVKGHFEVLKDISFSSGGEVKALVSAKTYQAVLSKKGEELRLSLKGGIAITKELVLELPPGVESDLESGEGVFLSSELIGQSFDLVFYRQVERMTSELFEDSEACFIPLETRRLDCQEDFDSLRGHQNCQLMMGTSDIPGRRFYTYFQETEEQILKLDFLTPGSDERLALFKGKLRTGSAQTHRLHQTECIRQFKSYQYSYKNSYCGSYGRFGYQCL